MPVDYSLRFRDYARFCPAISEMYTRFIDNKNPKRQMPAGITQADLNYLDPATNLFYLPNSLYSAGQAAKSDGAAAKKDMVTERDRDSTIILGDSGGFQIQMGSIKFKGDETRNRMMKWMEANCDWSMILDFPTGGIDMGTIDPHYDRLTADATPGLPDSGNKEALEALMAENGQTKYYNTCLLQTLINNDWFVKHRTAGATKFLNVVQGRDNEESKVWYEKVKHYPFEGWSLAGPHKENFYMTLHRLIDMRDDNVLQDRDWLHFLGVGKLEHGSIYTTIQRMIRKTVNENFTISYDVSSPFTTAAFGNLFLGYTLDNTAWTIQSAKCENASYNRGGIVEREDGNIIVPRGAEAGRPLFEIIQEAWDEKMAEEAEARAKLVYDEGLFDANTVDLAEQIRNKSRLIETEISKKLTMEDVCFNTDVKGIVPKGKFTSSWDVVSYAMMMNHNVNVHLEAVFESQDLYDKGDPARVPAHLLRMKEVIEEVFTSSDPRAVIEANRKILNGIAGDAAAGGVKQIQHFHYPHISEHTEKLQQMKAEMKVDAPEPVKVVDDLFNFGDDAA